MFTQFGPYRVVKQLGRGGMGAVYEARQESLGRKVAVKLLPQAFADDPRRVERFQREARATAMIRHPNIVRVHDVGEAEGTHFYSMDYIEGASLSEVILSAREQSRGGESRRDDRHARDVVERIAALADGARLASERL